MENSSIFDIGERLWKEHCMGLEGQAAGVLLGVGVTLGQTWTCFWHCQHPVHVRYAIHGEVRDCV